ncbi:MAG: hypothetical protein WC451_05520, partial [Patescibacteria group bacterium]
MAFIIEEETPQGRFVIDTPEELSFKQGSDPSLIDKVWGFFQDPEKEKAKAVQALVDSEALDISPSDAYRYRDQIDDGVKLDPMAVKASRRTSLTERVNQSWETGKAQVQQGLLASKFLINGDMAAYDEALKIKYPEYDFISEGRIESAVRAAAKMLPMTVDVGKEFLFKGLPVGMGAGATVAILGQLGPQAALPEEVVTVPAATALGFKAGGTAAAYKRVMELEGGLAVMELMNLEDAQGNKLDPNTVRATGLGIGAVNGLIELAQIKLLLKTVPGLEKVLGKAIIDTISSKTLKERLAKTAVNYGGVVLAETGQELAQESTNIIAEALAIELNNAAKGTDIPQATLEEILDRYYEIGTESAQAFMVMALPGSMATAAYKGGNKPKKVNPSKPPVQDSPAVKQAQETVQSYNGKKPIILGVDETVVDGENVITSFTMADPITGDVFTVPAQQKIQDDTVTYLPDQNAINDRLEKTTSDDLDAQIDRMIEGDDTAIERVFGKEADVPNFEAREDITPAEIVEPGANTEGEISVLDSVKAINKTLGEKGSIDLEPIVNLGRSIIAEGHRTYEAFTARAKELLGDAWEKVKELVEQAWKTLQNERGSVNIKSVTTKQGTGGNITAKENPTPEAENNTNLYLFDSDRFPLANEAFNNSSYAEHLRYVKNFNKLEYPFKNIKITRIIQTIPINDRVSLKVFPHGDHYAAQLYIDGLKDRTYMPDEWNPGWRGRTIKELDNNLKKIKHLFAGTIGDELLYNAREGSMFFKDIAEIKNNIHKDIKNIIDKKIHDDVSDRLSDEENSLVKKISEAWEYNKIANHGYGSSKYYVDKYSYEQKNNLIKSVKEALDKKKYKNIDYGIQDKSSPAQVDGETIIYFDIKGRQVSFHIKKEEWLKEQNANLPITHRDTILKAKEYKKDWIGVRFYKNPLTLSDEEYFNQLPNQSSTPKGGVQLNDVSSILNPVEIVENLRGLTSNIKEAMPHLEALGRNIYESGKVKFNEWSAAMKETLGDLWESFKDVMNQVYEFTKR